MTIAEKIDEVYWRHAREEISRAEAIRLMREAIGPGITEVGAAVMLDRPTCPSRFSQSELR